MRNQGTERWVIISGHEDSEISSLGQLRRHTYGKGTWPGFILKASVSHGYERVNLTKNCVHVGCLIHRLVAGAFCESRDGRNEVNHIDHNPMNNVASNLEWVTRSENNRHIVNNERHRKGKWPKRSGDDHWAMDKRKRNRVTNVEADNIRSEYLSGVMQRDIAKKYGISQSQVSTIIRCEVTV